MKFCSKCGKELMDEAVICINCGCTQDNRGLAATNDEGGFGWGLLGFCIPIVGLILYLIWKSTKPKTARSLGKGALISVICSVIFYIIYFVIILSILGSGSYF